MSSTRVDMLDNLPLIYLASNSPRRRELLDQIGVRFKALSIDVDETPLVNESPEDYVQRLSQEKAKAGIQQLESGVSTMENNALSNWQSTKKHATMDLVIGADTAVVCGGQILGKPQSAEDAKAILRLLSDKTHDVFTAVTITGIESLTVLSRNLVTFKNISDKDILAYIATNEGTDKAGSYAIQGKAAIFIEQLQGSYSGVMGLPLFETAKLLSQFGYNVLA